MRAATSKPAWYERRGLPVPAEVIQHRIEMLRRKEMRVLDRDALLTLREEFRVSMHEMRDEGDIEDHEVPDLLAQINAMPLPRKQDMAMAKDGKMKPVPLRKEYPSGTE